MKKPVKHYSSFTNYCIKNKHSTKDGVRCFSCSGTGRVIAPYSHRDPIEGWKMADRITCKTCNGTGLMDEKLAKKFYKLWKDAYDKDMKRYKKIEEIKKQILKKLTNREINFLKNHGIQ